MALELGKPVMLDNIGERIDICLISLLKRDVIDNVKTS
jgi:hypothetical protein